MKYPNDCIPDKFVCPAQLAILEHAVRVQIYSCIFTLALRLERSEANLVTARKNKHNKTELGTIYDRICIIERNNKNDERSIYHQVRVICVQILKLFKYCESQLNVEIIKYFINWCIKKCNIFYCVASPILEEKFVKKINTIIKNEKNNPVRQELLAITRLQTGISWNQNTNLRKSVCVCIC